MEASTSPYVHSDSIDRIKDILDSSDAAYEERAEIPARSALTYQNGFYVNCSALFIDIRGSKELAEKHTRPVLAKIYKCYISELTAILRDNSKINEVYIEGDCVWGIFNTPYKQDINELFSTAAKASSLIDTLNIFLKKKKYSTLTVGMGMAYGTSLVVKAGHKGSGVNEVVWLGKLVGEAAALCSQASKTSFDYEIMVSNTVYENLKESYKELLFKNINQKCYHGYIHNLVMNEWVENNE